MGAQDRISIPRQTGFTHSSAIDLGEARPEGFPADFTAEIFRKLASTDLAPPWGGVSSNHFGVNFKYTLAGAPTANAGPDVAIYTSEQIDTVIHGAATDPGGDALTYRWLEDASELLPSTSVDPNSAAILRLRSLPSPLTIGSYTLTLEVTDSEGKTATDTMVLTILNTPPNSQPGTVQAVEIGVGSVNLEGSVSDFDGDTVSYQWVVNGEPVGSSDPVTATPGGVETVPMSIAPSNAAYSFFLLGANRVELWVTDEQDHGFYIPAFGFIDILFQDTTVPALTATADSSILWPPNGELRPITIAVNTNDNSGGSVQLGAVVTSNESDGSGEQDWTEPVIDAGSATIVVNLRAERLGTGDGRVYTVTVTATDGSGNDSSVDVKIRVPHDRKKK